MKRISFLIVIVFFSIININCKKKKKMVLRDIPLYPATVVRDCTGTYLRIDLKDYLVCNTSMVDKFAEGTNVLVYYVMNNDCKELENKVVCMMYHDHKGMVNVVEVRKN